MLCARFVKYLSLFSFSAFTINCLADDSIKFNNSIEPSFAATYLDATITPKHLSYADNPYTYRISPKTSYAMTQGFNYNNFEVSNNYLKFNVKELDHLIATVYVIHTNHMKSFAANNINKEFQGELDTGSPNGMLSTPTVLANIANECFDAKFSHNKVRETVFTHLNCKNRNVQLFATRPETKVPIAQTLDAAFKKSNDIASNDTDKHLVLINYHGNLPIKFNPEKPFESLSLIPLPVHTISFYIDNLPLDFTVDEKFVLDLKEELTKDNTELKYLIEDRILKDLADTSKMSYDFQKYFKKQSIKRLKDNSDLELANITENLFDSTLTVFANKDNSILATSIMTLPILHESNGLEDLAQKLARDVNCRSSYDIESIKTWDFSGVRVTCSETFGTKHLPKNYYIYHYPSFTKNEPEISQPIQVITVLGDTNTNDIEDIIFNVELANGVAWNIDFDKLSAYELNRIFEIKNTKAWYNEVKGNNNDLSKPWGKFVNRSRETLAQLGSNESETVFKALTGVADELSIELKNLREEPEE